MYDWDMFGEILQAIDNEPLAYCERTIQDLRITLMTG